MVSIWLCIIWLTKEHGYGKGSMAQLEHGYSKGSMAQLEPGKDHISQN